MTRFTSIQNALIRSVLLSLALAVAISGFVLIGGSAPAFAAEKMKLTKKKITMETGTAARLRVKNVHKKVKWSSSNRKIVRVTRIKGKYGQSVVLKAGKKTGTCWVRARIGKKVLKCRVRVKASTPAPDPVVKLDPYDLAYTDFSIRLMKETLRRDSADKAADTCSNVLISPDSMMTALMMTENGAAGSTLSDMHRTLTGSKTPVSSKSGAVTRQGVNKYLSRLHSRLTGSKMHIYTLANSIWTRRDLIKVNDSFRAVIEKYYNASFREGNFDRATVDEMNAWVKSNTRNMIDQIISPDPGLSPDARMVLINAIAFDAEWAEPFRDGQVMKNQTFTQANGKKQKVTMLNGMENTYLKLAGGTGFCKYYKGGEIAFVGLLPPKGTDVRQYAKKLTGKSFLTAWKKSRSTSQRVLIKLPCFRYDYGTSMKKNLVSMGMGLAFSNAANFQPMMAPDSPEYQDGLRIDDVIHKTHIEVNQDGTKAAAVTAVIVDKAGAVFDQDPPKKVYLNRPFVYALVDCKTGNPLFLGLVETIPAEK